jgi:gliding motility-associated-like protein
VKLKVLHFYLIASVFLSCAVAAQDIGLHQQFNGRYDFIFIGNTMNLSENNLGGPCVALTQSSALLNLSSSDEIESAYLYWAGSGTGDLDVKLNGQDITAQQTFNFTQTNFNFTFFSAFADVTQLVQSTGNGTYTLSDLDVNPWLTEDQYCLNATNFAGWALVIVYKNEALPLNQINIYDGLQGVPLEVDITLDNLNVVDNAGARIGFVAWEGDAGLDINESLRINGNVISNPPLNPATNAFNGTNSFTGASDLYNMDLDAYDIQNNIEIGDATAEIQLTSGEIINGVLQGDFVMINVVVTKLNNQLPDATIVIDNLETFCNSRGVTANYTVSNMNSTEILPAGVPIAIYASGILVGSTTTAAAIAIGASESGQVTFTLPDGVPDAFELEFDVDDNGAGQGMVTELIETNNNFTINGELLPAPGFNQPNTVYACNEGLGKGTFDFSSYATTIGLNPGDVISFYETQEDAINSANAILDNANYVAQTTPHTIFVRVQSDPCYNTTSFELLTKNCPPEVFNYVSVNNDGLNDTFHIKGLHDVFINFELSVFNRWGALVWKGNNDMPDWDGIPTKGILLDEKSVPDGTYYYVLELHDPGYPEPLTGFLYLTH